MADTDIAVASHIITLGISQVKVHTACGLAASHRADVHVTVPRGEHACTYTDIYLGFNET